MEVTREPKSHQSFKHRELGRESNAPVEVMIPVLNLPQARKRSEKKKRASSAALSSYPLNGEKPFTRLAPPSFSDGRKLELILFPPMKKSGSIARPPSQKTKSAI